MTTAAAITVYIGTYTRREPPPAGVTWTYQGRGEGIYVYRLNPETGALTQVATTRDVINPSFLALHPHQHYLYAVNQVVTFGDQPGGAVSAFAIEPGTGTLTPLNRQPSGGTGPAHLTVDASGRWVLVANFRSGTVAVLPAESDGRLGVPTDAVQHTGSSIHPRQAAPHAHSVTLDPTNRYAYVPDLGIDKIMIYRFDATQGTLAPNDPPWVQMTPGAGPRHFAFHPNGRHAYVINELDSTVTAFAFDDATGALREVQTLSTLPDDFAGSNTCADIHVPTFRS